MKYFFTFYLFLTGVSLFAQQDFYAGSTFMAGIPFHDYGNNKNNLYSRKISSTLGVSLFVQYRFFNRLGFEAGVSQNVQKLRMQDKKFAERNPGIQVRLASTNQYWSYYGALSYAQPITPKSKIYTSLGYCINHAGDGSLTETKNFVISDEDITLKNNYKRNNATAYLEAGFETQLSNTITWLAGIRFNKGLSSLTEGSMISEKDGNVLSTDTYTTDGSFLGITTGLKFNLFHKEKKEKLPEETPVTAPVPQSIPKAIEGRSLVITNKIIVKNSVVTVFVWDDQKVDGDMVSLNLNGQWIIRDYTLEKKMKSFIVNLKSGENTFVLHALNLGKIKPNTAALMVDDGITKQKLVLESDLESSGTLIIEYKK